MSRTPDGMDGPRGDWRCTTLPLPLPSPYPYPTPEPNPNMVQAPLVDLP